MKDDEHLHVINQSEMLIDLTIDKSFDHNEKISMPIFDIIDFNDFLALINQIQHMMKYNVGLIDVTVAKHVSRKMKEKFQDTKKIGIKLQ